VYRGADDHIHEIFLPRGGAAWKTGDLSAAAGAPAATGEPSAYVRSDDVNSVVYRGTDNDIHELYLPRGAANWLTGDLTASTDAVAAAGKPSAYVRSDNMNSVVYRGIDNHVHELFLTQGGAAWSTGDLTAIAGGAAAAGDSAPFLRSDLVNSVMYRGSNNQIYELSLSPGGVTWKVNNLSLITGAPPE